MRIGLLLLLLGLAVGCADPNLRGGPGEPGPARTPAPSSAAPAQPESSATPAADGASTAPVSSGAAVAPDTSTSAAPADALAESKLAKASARGQCSDRRTLKTAKGDVSCYPFRCRDGRCLTSCDSRKDCAGSDGPGDLKENGWPLDCNAGSHECYPLPPSHVHPR